MDGEDDDVQKDIVDGEQIRRQVILKKDFDEPIKGERTRGLENANKLGSTLQMVDKLEGVWLSKSWMNQEEVAESTERKDVNMPGDTQA